MQKSAVIDKIRRVSYKLNKPTARIPTSTATLVQKPLAMENIGDVNYKLNKPQQGVCKKVQTWGKNHWLWRIFVVLIMN